MNETGIVQYVRELYPGGCLVTMFVSNEGVQLLNTEVGKIEEADKQ